MIWPDGKEFAFTIIDDTDNATLEKVEPIYSYLSKKQIRITKTTWVYSSRNWYSGDTLQDQPYLDFLQGLKENEFEIALHNVGSGEFTRKEIMRGVEEFKQKLGYYPLMQVNHGSNPDNIYWGNKRFSPILNFIIKGLKGANRQFFGDDEKSKYFWGDLVKNYIKFVRNRAFYGINTLEYDPKMPYYEKNKAYSNFWFSCSNGYTLPEFNELVNPQTIDKLKKEKGLSIVYTHFGHGFVDDQGKLNPVFKKTIDYLASQNGWFAPASEILNYLIESKNSSNSTVNLGYLLKLDLIFLYHSILKKRS